MKILALIVVCITGAMLLYATGEMPDWADPKSPASSHVSPRYIEKAVEDTDVPNMVTAVLGDYRGYDTLGEAIVIFTAGLACVLILMKRKANDKTTLSKRHRSDRM